jgi:hypothetical protein
MEGLSAILTFLFCQKNVINRKVGLQKCKKHVCELDAAIPENIFFV